MSKKFQLQIPEPCHEDWDKMTPGDKGRFCDSCQKTVHDFTGMSDMQLIAFFKKPSTGSVCGRFYNGQLERDFEIPRKRLPWIKYFLQVMIPAFLISSKAKSQGKPILILRDTVKCEAPKVLTRQIVTNATGEKIDGNKIIGRVVDSRGQPLPSATVIIKGTAQGTVTTNNGSFKIQPGENWEKATLIVSYVGFLTQEIVVRRGENQKEIIVSLGEQMKGEVVIVGYTVRKKKPPKPLLQRIFRDTTFKFFKVYPNPVVAGASANVELKKAEPGEYNVDLVNMSGQIVYSGVQRFELIKEVNSFTIPYTIAGSYLIQLTNKKSGKKHAEKIIIQ